MFTRKWRCIGHWEDFTIGKVYSEDVNGFILDDNTRARTGILHTSLPTKFKEVKEVELRIT